jgi:hypothetical protein
MKKIFSDLREIIRLERRYLPLIDTLVDRNICAQIGYHEAIKDKPLTLKLLCLLDIGPIATVQRHLVRLVAIGVVVKRRHRGDRRSFTLHLSANTKREYQRYAAALAARNR